MFLISRLVNHIFSKWKSTQNFLEEFRQFQATSQADRFAEEWRDYYSCLYDRTNIILFDGPYVFTTWAARILAKVIPAVHIDIASYLYITIFVSPFLPRRFYDYRPPQVVLPSWKQESLKNQLYDDPLDPNGDL